MYPDLDFGREAFTYVLESGDEGTVHVDHLLEYSDDPEYMARLALHKLTVEARKRVEESPSEQAGDHASAGYFAGSALSPSGSCELQEVDEPVGGAASGGGL